MQYVYVLLVRGGVNEGFYDFEDVDELLRCMVRLRLIDDKEQALRFKLFVLHMDDVSIITPAYEIHKNQANDLI